MPDLNQLRVVGQRVTAPPFEALQAVARRRDRRAAVTTVAGLVAATVVVVGGAIAITASNDDALPDPVITPTPTPTPSLEPTPEPSPSPSHRSDTSMTPEEVVHADNARLVLTGVSADDPDFRISIWQAECLWCPKPREGTRPHPVFEGLAITTDGFASAQFVRPPFDSGRPIHVVSPGPGMLLVIDAANGPEWLVREDGSVTRLARVVEEREAADPRLWHVCGDNYGIDYQVSWCALDPAEDTFYVWEGAWRSTFTTTESMVSPGASVEPWGRNFATDDLVAYWDVDGVRRTRILGPAFSAGVVFNLPPGVMSFWSLDLATDTVSVYTSSDRGDTWQTSRLSAPFNSRQIFLSRTPGGGMLALQWDAFYGDGSPHEGEGIRLWRSPTLDGGTFETVYESKHREHVWGSDAVWFAVLDDRIWSGGLWSDDDGLTWTAVDRWR